MKKRELELKTKKLMTVAKSKYYMLKVNFPKQAELVDSEPLIDETIESPELQDGQRQSQFTNDME